MRAANLPESPAIRLPAARLAPGAPSTAIGSSGHATSRLTLCTYVKTASKLLAFIARHTLVVSDNIDLAQPSNGESMLRFIAYALLVAALCFVLGQALTSMARSMTFRTILAVCGLVCAAVLAVALSLDWISDERQSPPTNR